MVTFILDGDTIFLHQNPYSLLSRLFHLNYSRLTRYSGLTKFIFLFRPPNLAARYLVVVFQK